MLPRSTVYARLIALSMLWRRDEDAERYRSPDVGGAYGIITMVSNKLASLPPLSGGRVMMVVVVGGAPRENDACIHLALLLLPVLVRHVTYFSATITTVKDREMHAAQQKKQATDYYRRLAARSPVDEGLLFYYGG